MGSDVAHRFPRVVLAYFYVTEMRKVIVFIALGVATGSVALNDPADLREITARLTAWMPAHVTAIKTPRIRVLEAMTSSDSPDLAAVLRDIRLADPASEVTLLTLQRMRGPVIAASKVPLWFHQTLVSFGPIVEASDPNVIQALIQAGTSRGAGSPYTTDAIVRFIATNWLLNCIHPSRLFPRGRFCRPDGAGGSWTLSPAQRRNLVGTLLISEHLVELARLGITVPAVDFDSLAPDFVSA